MTGKDIEIRVTPSGTPDFQTEFASQIAEIAPEVIADGKIDFGKLRELLGDDTTDDHERFGLYWPGKRRALNISQNSTTATQVGSPGTATTIVVDTQ